MLGFRCWVGLLVLTLSSALVIASERVVGDFSGLPANGALPAEWSMVALPSVQPTQFSMVSIDGTTVLQMDAANSASSLFRPIDVDTTETPTLRWQWRIRNLVEKSDLQTKQGDDFPVRLYVMFDYPLDRLSYFDRIKLGVARLVSGQDVPAAAICYVWDSRLPAGTLLPNAYTDRVKMIVVESGDRNLDRWVMEARDVAADFRSAFGEEPPRVNGIALAADTDQTGETVRSWFGNVTFDSAPPVL